MRKIKLCAILIILSSILPYLFLRWWGYRTIKLTTTTTLTMPVGQKINSFINSCHQLKLINNPWLFKLWIILDGRYSLLKAGTYLFKKEASAFSIVNKIVNGKAHFTPLVTITIPEGFTVAQVINKATTYHIDTKNNFHSAVTDQKFLHQLGIKSNHAEGYLYPATYTFYKRMPSAKEFITKLVMEFFNKMPANYLKKLERYNISLHDAVIIASMIEKETQRKEERALVAEVIWRRLNKKKPLGIDASLIYGIKHYDGNLRNYHLLDRNNLYNTRIHIGLPPTPISNPSWAALLAVVNPSNHGYYFYVLNTQDKQKKHHFSKTLKEHNKWVHNLKKATQ